MRKLSKLAALSPADQNLVLELCSKNPYDHVVTLLAKPRSEGGLALQTSRSALCRFASTAHPDPDRLTYELNRLVPLLESTSADPARFPAAIRLLIQQQVFKHLSAEGPFEKIERPLRWLFKSWNTPPPIPHPPAPLRSHNSSHHSHDHDTIIPP